MRFSYFSAVNLPPAGFVFILGSNRSGKTTLGNLLGSCGDIEHIDEPWPLIQIVILAGLGVIKTETAQDMFKTYLYELINDRILMRGVNFRHQDLSYILSQKSKKEVAERMALNSRADVNNYLNKTAVTFVVTLTNTTPWAYLISKFLPSAKIILTIRAGAEVAREVSEKAWLSNDELLRPSHSNLLSRHTSDSGLSQYIPWWVSPKDRSSYLKKDNYGRALYYWMAQMDFDRSLEVKLLKSSRLFIARFSELITAPDGVLTTMNPFVPLRRTLLTVKQIKSIQSRPRRTPIGLDAGLLSESEWERFKRISNRWKLPYQTRTKNRKGN